MEGTDKLTAARAIFAAADAAEKAAEAAYRLAEREYQRAGQNLGPDNPASRAFAALQQARDATKKAHAALRQVRGW